MRLAEERRLFDRRNRYKERFFFSHLYTAMQRSGFQRFLHLDTDNLDEPVPDDRNSELSLVMLWLYGDRRRDVAPAVRTQNPYLNRLDDVLQHDGARRRMVQASDVEEPDLVDAVDRARELTRSEYDHLTAAMDEAWESLQNALKKVSTGYAGEEEPLSQARDIATMANDLLDRIEAGHHEAERERSGASAG
ncbi:MAG: hypothetical protein GF320_03265 [Armatimonadia bacterium]|nr:hypothetical protein [Armatimonadia bacterium]